MFTALIGLMTLLGLGLIIFGMNTLSGLRAYVVAGGRWSEAERAAVYSLLRYTVSYDEKDYQNFTELMNTVSLPKRLRAELEKKNPEFDLITGGFEGTGEGEAGGVKRFTVLIGCPGRPRSTSARFYGARPPIACLAKRDNGNFLARPRTG